MASGRTGTVYTKGEARHALHVLDDALETEEGWYLARTLGVVGPIYGALIVLQDYLTNSSAKPLTRERTREELYAEHLNAT